MTSKRTIYKTVSDYTSDLCDVLDGLTLDEVISELERIRSFYAGRTITLQVDRSEDYMEIDLQERREETDQELEARLYRDAQVAKIQQDRRMAEYELLKKEFGEK